jgi:ubiquitin-protein ligase
MENSLTTSRIQLSIAQLTWSPSIDLENLEHIVVFVPEGRSEH